MIKFIEQSKFSYITIVQALGPLNMDCITRNTIRIDNTIMTTVGKLVQ